MTKTCKECGKKFYTTYTWETWVYRIQNKYYCSYTCYRQAEKRNAKKKPSYQARTRRKTDAITQMQSIVEASEVPVSVDFISKKINRKKNTVYEYARRLGYKRANDYIFKNTK